MNFKPNIDGIDSRRILFVTLVLGLIGITCLGILEIGLRIYHSYKSPDDLSLFVPKPNGSFDLKPNMTVTTKVDKEEINIITNSHGMRWKEIPRKSDPKYPRIAFVGDSFTFGCWASRVEKSFVGVFDSVMSSKGYETLNFGVGGYGLDDIEMQLKDKVVGFQPKYIFLMFFNGNDFRDTFLGIHKYDFSNGAANLDVNNIRVKIPEEYRKRAGRLSYILWNSAIYGQLSNAFARIGAHKTGDFGVSNDFLSYSFWSQRPYPAVAQEARDVSINTLKSISDICRQSGIRLIIVAIPYKEQVASLAKNGSDFDINLPQGFIQKFAADQNIPYLDLLDKLRDYSSEHKDLYYQFDPHFNERGHQVVGKIIADWFIAIVNDPGSEQ
jgi:lysophospholipase L1-like esterase